MKKYIADLNKAFESRVKLGIMSILLANDTVNFATLKEELQLTDGNMSSHLSSLEKAGYLSITKKFVGMKPNTSYAVTSEGRKAFGDHLDALERLILKTN